MIRGTYSKRTASSFLLGIALASALFLLAAPSTALANDADNVPAADNSSHTVVLEPGQVYDVGKAQANTTVKIVKSGSYTLQGSSTKVGVNIEGGDVELYLADGLNIDPGASAHSGKGTAAIEVKDYAGTVRIISKAGASIYLGAYLGHPAIQKNGTTNMLVFATEDTSHPGTIEAQASGVGSNCGIGGFSSSVSHRKTGNYVFESGIVNAYGGNGGAGIGASSDASVDGITINGGTIRAIAAQPNGRSVAGRGAGIGTTHKGTATNITINGGNVYAKGSGLKTTGSGYGEGAGIGGGNNSSGSYITINGGTVTAIGGEHLPSEKSGAAGIGGGTNCRGDNITITGGTVTATGGTFAAGIGGGSGGKAYAIHISGGTVTATGGIRAAGIGGRGTVSDIVISGGTVTATGGDGDGSGYVSGAGIGGSNSATVENIAISGGIVRAQGGYKAAGIGADNSGNVREISITGGTIVTRGGSGANVDLGGANSDAMTTGYCKLYISGGSVDAIKVLGTPRQWTGAAFISKTTVTLQDATADTALSHVTIDGITYTYGMHDVRTLDTDKLYLWLPDVARVTAATDAAGVHYNGSVPAKQSGTLYRDTQISLAKNGGASDGSAKAAWGSATASDVHAPSPQTGYILTGYSDAATGGTLIMDTLSAFTANTVYTDAAGTWAYAGNPLTLYATWRASAYHIAFDRNKPDGASTAVTGDTAAMDCTYGTQVPLTTCGSTLPGYAFTGWNTKPDGTGTPYSDGASVSDLTTEDGATVTLYAQWRALEYDVSFDGNGETSGTMPTQHMAFDTPVKLTQNDFEKTGSSFLGWSRGAFGSFYADGATVCNLCTLDANGVPQGDTLTAAWAAGGRVAITVTDDGVPVTGLEDALKLVIAEQELDGFTADPQHPGVYTLGSASSPLPEGDYNIVLTGYDTTGKKVTVGDGGTGTATLDYCTVDITAEEHASAWIEQGNNHVTHAEHVLIGSALTINASTSEGYAFESYTAFGHEPGWNPDAQTANQQITVTGKATIEAHPVPIRYQVVFDARGGTGTMADQDMVYSESQNLFANTFTRTGYTFAGWTTTPEWTGTLYADGASVQNLTTVDKGTVTLYAQWNPQDYLVGFDGNGAEGYMDDEKCFYDIPSQLSPNEFARENQRFTNWNTEADGSGESLVNAQTVTNLSTEAGGRIMLYAQWEHDTYTVRYEANDGSGAARETSCLSGEETTLADYLFEREGYTLSGWNTADDGSGTAYALNAAVEDLAATGQTAVLYAQWTASPGPGPQPGPDPTPSPDARPLPKTGDASFWLPLLLSAFGILGLLAHLQYANMAMMPKTARKK